MQLCPRATARGFRPTEFDPARGIGFDKVYETPRDGAGRDSLEEEVKSGAGREAAQKAADGAAGADIDRLNAQHGMRASGFDHGIDVELDVVDADDLASVNVDDLLIEEIAFEEEQAFGAIRSGPIRGIGGGVDIGVNSGDGGEGKYAVAGFGFDNERGDAVTIFLRGESDFAHVSGRRAGRVIDRGAEEFGKRQRSHPGRG